MARKGKIVKAKGVILTPEQRSRATPEAIKQSETNFRKKKKPHIPASKQTTNPQNLGDENSPNFVGPPSPGTKANPIKDLPAFKYLDTPPSGWKNVINTLKASHPFAKEHISATTNNQFVNSALEFIANSPAATALALSGVTGLARGAIGLIGGKAATSSIGNVNLVGASTGIAGRGIVANSINTKATGSLLVKAGFSVAAALFIQKAAETYPFAKFEIAEAMDKLGYARAKAVQEGDQEAVNQLNQLQDEILNPQGWELVLSKLPWTNIHRAASRNIDAAISGTVVFNKIIADNLQQEANGETDSDKWKRARQEQAEMDKAAVDYYNEQRKQQLIWENEARAEARLDEARDWSLAQEESRRKEREDREAIALFWLEYRKKSQEIADNSRPSNLNFGLI